MEQNNAIRRAAESVGGLSALATILGVSPPTVSQWAAGIRRVPAHHCPAIESATENGVMRWDLRPEDWRRIWPELISHPSAPAEVIA